MSAEERIAELESKVKMLEADQARKIKALVNFSRILILKIHQLDKNIAHNLGELARAIKDVDHFDLDDYLSQLARAEFKFDQVDAAFFDSSPPPTE